MVETYERITDMKVGPRQPYGGQLVFAAFAGSHQDDVLRPVRDPDAVDDAAYTDEGFPEVGVHVGRIEEAAVDIVGRQEGEVILTVLQAVAGEHEREGGRGDGDRETSEFHGVVSLRCQDRRQAWQSAASRRNPR